MWGGLHARLSIIIAPPGGVRISIATSMSVSLSVRMSVFVSFCPYFRSNSCVGRLYLRLACSGSLAFWLRSLTRVISYCKKASTIADFLHYFIQRYGNTDRETSSYNTLMQYFAPSPECEVASFFFCSGADHNVVVAQFWPPQLHSGRYCYDYLSAYASCCENLMSPTETEHLVEFGYVVLEICWLTDVTDIQTRLSQNFAPLPGAK